MSQDRELRHRSLEWWCRLTLQVLAVCFVVVGAQFLFLPDATVRGMNALGSWLGDFTPAPASALRFWLSLATGYMVLVTALAYVAQRDLRRHRDLVAFLALGKGTSSLVALGFYLYASNAFIYLANFYVDGSITLMALAIWLAVPSLGDSASADTAAAGMRREAPPVPAMNAMLEAMIPSGGAFAPGARELPIGRDIETFVEGLAPAARRAMRVGLRLFDFAPFFLPPLRRRRFSRLPLEERIAVLEAWERSRFAPRRQAIHTLKMLAMIHFYGRPEIERQLGYVQPLVRVPRPEGIA
jgi:hypothetical protein